MPEEKKIESPDTDKTLELTDDKLPDMGKGEELVEEKVGEGTEEEKLSPELEATMKRKGFKTPDELAKAYDASEKRQTELEKDARLKSLMPSGIPERPKTEREFTPYPELEKEPIDMSKAEFEAYQGQREKAHDERLIAKYEDAEADKKWKRDHEEVMRVVNKDPTRFEEIKPQLRTLHQRYPDAPLEEIYPMADEMEKEQSKKRGDKFLKDTFGADADIDKLKTVISRVRPPVIADATGTKGSGKQKPEDKIWDDIAKADMRRDE